MTDTYKPLFPGSEPDSSRHAVGEPITLSSGDVLTIYKRPDSGDFEFSVEGRTSTYSPEDLAVVGEGDPRIGIMKVAQHYHRTDGSTAVAGLRKPFSDEIRASRLSGDQ